MNTKLTLSLCTCLFLWNAQLHAEAIEQELKKVDVEAEIIDESGIGTKTATNAKEIQIFSSAELLNPYKAISLEPGVDIRFNDPFGMQISHKIRGKSDRNIGETIESLPIKGIGPGGGLSTMVDIENIESVSVEKGAIQADSGFGYGSDNGMVDMHIKKPAENFGTTLKQAIGTENFSKSYIRMDSGNLGDIAKIFASSSFTQADKFKGEGKSPDRKNFAAGIANTSGQSIEWELYGIYNDEKKHSYKGLTYDQSKDLNKYGKLDYQTTDPSLSSYYDYNKENFQTYTILGKLKVPFSSDSSLTIRPYFLNDKGYSYSTSGSNVMDWLVDHDTYGAVIEYAKNLYNGKMKLGYWYQEDEPPGPPTSRKLRKPGSLDFIKWERIIDIKKNHTFNAPFITYEKAFGNAVVEAGLKYLWQSSPHLISYNTAGIGDVSYKEALSLVHDIDFTLPSNTYEMFLPNIGATYFLNDNSNIKASYGKNYNVPNYSFGGNMISYFNNPIVNKNEQLLQKMWSDLKPELSDNFDISYTYDYDKFSITSSIFYSFIQNVGGNFYDPILDMYYQQNTAEANCYGLEIGAAYEILDNLTINASATYNHYAFTSDIRSSAGAYIQSKGNQLPDVPKYFANISAVYDLNGYKIAPIVRYLGKRYVDVENKYSIDPHYLVDIAINKEITLHNNHKMDFSVSISNLLGEKYISTVSTSETNVAEVGPTYIVGSPRAIFASVQYKF
ncbi:MAG: TonB-dependent receptor [Sulfurovaceae bacterium]|nr:TonB-dependent receptor [Sulfurovaceae bacterium]